MEKYSPWVPVLCFLVICENALKMIKYCDIKLFKGKKNNDLGKEGIASENCKNLIFQASKGKRK